MRLRRTPRDLRRVLISAGPTREPIDAVRFLSNYSTGQMGVCLAAEALRRRCRVTIISGPVSVAYPPRAKVVRVERADEMARALRRQAVGADAVIMAAAVADFRPSRLRAGKLPRQGGLVLRLAATKDILGHLPRRPGQVRVGFALESGRVVPRAQAKLRRKQLDLLLAQRVRRAHAPFGAAPVRAWLLQRRGPVMPLGTASKAAVARVLLDKIEALWYGQPKIAS